MDHHVFAGGENDVAIDVDYILIDVEPALVGADCFRVDPDRLSEPAVPKISQVAFHRSLEGQTRHLNRPPSSHRPLR